ncbi:unnamed protein product [Mycena citricolor]|uniref:Uncharacterized protein n=2 Tax=Mycena citricolor TaxID=2018698 RepID=A0AAD2GSL8_9AGAR|nr:unnamed protein product [Mycena citricolor]CAK5267404.1 unnamed protein product [Mycena citricolor]CAK5273915.1 unnamed protein product [Mycena citricolor]
MDTSYTADALQDIVGLEDNVAMLASTRLGMFSESSTNLSPEHPDPSLLARGRDDWSAPVPLLISELGLGSSDLCEADTPEKRRALLAHQFQEILMDATNAQTPLDLLSDEDFLGDEINEIMAREQGDEDDDLCFDFDARASSAYRPYPNKAMMLLDIMDNLPRCRFTSLQLSLIIHFAKQLGAPDIPSLKSFRQFQQVLQEKTGHKPVRCVSQFENVFYMNDIRDAIARDLANPLVAPHLHFYPEEPSGPISEVYQAERWFEYTASQLTPMYSRGHKRWWIEELSRLYDGTFVIPHTWIVRQGVLTADASVVIHNPDGSWTISSEERTILAADLELDFGDITALFGQDFQWTDVSTVQVMPNVQRKLVDEDEDLFVVMVSPWADDVSGNRSKQYNKHMNMYTGNGCLPGRLLQQEFHMHFLSSSPHATSPEQFSAFRDQVKATETDPIRCFNAATKRKARVILRVPSLPADNPQQSEESSHMGSNANFPCRKCHWGGTKIEKESDELYHRCHYPGIMRNTAEIRTCLRRQLELATRGDSKRIEELQRTTGTKDKITQHWIGVLLDKFKLMKSNVPRPGVEDIAVKLNQWLDEQPGDKMNPLLDLLGLDPSQDTPIELLHTVLLGIMKYIWHFMNTKKWSDEDRHLLAIRLQSTDLSGLSVPPIRAAYMIQYKNNLIGKHFKTLMQTLAFHVHGIATPEEFSLMKAAGDLGARLWVPEIDDMTTYLAEIEVAVANILDAFDAVDPSRILDKIKIHLLTHIADDIRRFGPPIRSATEIQESYNAVFRLCSVYSNRQAPSRDISTKFASMARMKHLLCGGLWYNADRDHWINAGDAVCRVLQDDATFQQFLGWTKPKDVSPGSISAMPKRIPLRKWTTTHASRYQDSTLSAKLPNGSTAEMWKAGQTLTAQSGDAIQKGGWVVALDPHAKVVFGRVIELLHSPVAIVTIECFVMGEKRHPDFKWPVLRRPTGQEIVAGAKNFWVLEGSAVQLAISVQHDCRRGGCEPNIVRKEKQEREETNQITKLIQHSDDDRFILNLSACHNHVQLCRILPPEMTMLEPLHPDRKSFHTLMSSQAQSIKTKKRKRTAEKRRATAAAKREDADRAEVEAGRAEKVIDEEADGAADSDLEGSDAGGSPGMETEELAFVSVDLDERPRKWRKAAM